MPGKAIRLMSQRGAGRASKSGENGAKSRTAYILKKEVPDGKISKRVGIRKTTKQRGRNEKKCSHQLGRGKGKGEERKEKDGHVMIPEGRPCCKKVGKDTGKQKKKSDDRG